jgi:choline dehydrogenase-like flavoprotein
MTSDRIYEYIVVGTGLSGAQAVETLLDAGREVLLLDVGYKNESKVTFPDDDFVTIRQNRYDQHRLFLGENYEGIPWEKIKTGAQLTPGRKYLTKGLERWLGMSSESFFPYESLAYGGLGNAWGAGCYMYSDKEFERMGIDRALFLPSYQKVADRVGITQPDADGEAYSISGLNGLLPSVRPEESIQAVYDRYKLKKAQLNEGGFFASTPSVAITTVDRDDRKAFGYEDMEFWHDNSKSVYRPWIAFDKLLMRPNITSIFGKLVTRFEEKTDCTLVYCIDVLTKEEYSYRCRKLILCSGVLGTARIVLRSVDPKARLPLLCNPYAYVPMINWRRLGSVPEQRKNGMGQLVLYYDRLKDNSDVSMAALFTYRSLMLFRLVKETPLNMADARAVQQYLMPAIVIAGIHHSEQYGDRKYIELQADSSSPTGDKLFAEYILSSDEEDAVKQKEKAYFKVLRGLGCIPISRLNPGNGSSIHYAGTLPFSAAEKTLTTAIDGRLHGTGSVFIADGSSFKFLPAKGISFTLMANAERVAANSLHYQIHNTAS